MPKEIFEVVRERFHLSDRTQYICAGTLAKRCGDGSISGSAQTERYL